MSFEKLLDEFEALQKSMAADQSDKQEDQDIQDAAGEGDDEEDDEFDPEAEGDADGDKDDGEETMGKSFSFELDNGTRVDAIDGTELVKSLMVRLETGETKTTEALTKALELIKGQGELIKSLSGKVDSLAKSGRGRASTLTMNERPDSGSMQKSESAGMGGTELLAKCLSAQAAGRITGLDVARVESALGRGQAAPADVIQRISA